MRESIRCCISCILPCGALDVIRIVHSNGRVQEITKSIRAEEIMKANPKHVLRKSSLLSSAEGVISQIVVLPPDAELKRGKIYFLMPVSSLPEKSRSVTTRKKKKRDNNTRNSNNNKNISSNNNDETNSISLAKVLVSDRYLSEILTEKISTQKDRRRGRVGVWRPHLESISEVPSNT